MPLPILHAEEHKMFIIFGRSGDGGTGRVWRGLQFMGTGRRKGGTRGTMRVWRELQFIETERRKGGGVKPLLLDFFSGFEITFLI